MLAAETTPGYVPPALLKQGRDFNCSSTICYGIGTFHSAFLSLQNYLNKFAGAVGFKPVTVDGFIGDSTLTAFRKVVAYILKRAGAGATMKFGAANTPALTLTRPQLATHMNSALQVLEFWTGALSNPPNPRNASDTVNAGPFPVNLPPITSPPAPGQSEINLPDLTLPSGGSFGPDGGIVPPGALVVVPVDQDTGAQASGLARVPWWAWVLGGTALVGGVTAVALTRRRRTV